MTDPTDANEVDAQVASLVALPQFLIDSISSHLDLKSLVRLQLTCRDLHTKCLAAQRLKEARFSRIIVNYKNDLRTPALTAGAEWDELRLNEKEFKASKFHFRSDELVFRVTFETAGIKLAGECLFGRGTVEKLHIDVADIDERADPVLFEKLAKELKISKLCSFGLPVAFWQLPSIRQMTNICCWGDFPLHLDYLAETSFEICYLLECEENDGDFIALNTVLKKWAAGQVVIKDWEFPFRQFSEDDFFNEFNVVAEDGIQPEGRPLVVRAADPVGDCGYTVERSDGERLYVDYSTMGKLKLSNTPIEASEMDSEMERELADELDYGSGDEEDYDDFYTNDDSFDEMDDY